MQREEAVQCRLTNSRRAQQPRLKRFTDERDRAEQAGDHGGAVERHLAPRQNVTHKAGAHHHQIDKHADDPCDFTWCFVRPVVKTAEDVCIDRHKEQRSAVHVEITDHMAAIYVTHNVFDAGKGHIDMRRVVHNKHDAGGNLQRQTEGQHDAPNPHPIQVLGCGDHQGAVDQANNWQAAFKPLCEARLRFVVVVGNTGHGSVSP